MSASTTTLGQLLRAKLDATSPASSNWHDIDRAYRSTTTSLWKVHGFNVQTALYASRKDALEALCRTEDGQLEEVLLSTPCDAGDTLYTVFVDVPYEDSYELMFTCSRKMAAAIANIDPDNHVEVRTMAIG